MSRIVALSVLLSLGWVAQASAAPYTEFEGKVASVDADKFTVTLDIDGKSQTFSCTRTVKVYRLKGGKKPSAELQDNGLKALSEGDKVTLTTHKDGDKDVAGAIRIMESSKKPKK